MILNRNIFKEKREAKNLSVEDLANELGIKINELKEIEDFEKEIDYKNLAKIKEILDINDQEIKDYFENYYKIKTKETNVIRKYLVLHFFSFAYLLSYIPMIATQWVSLDSMKYVFTISLIGFCVLVGSYTSFLCSKKFISNKKYFSCLILFTILFILFVATYVIIMALICNYLSYVVH